MTKTSIHDRMMAVYRRQVPDKIPVVIYDQYLARGACERALREMGLGIIDFHPVVSLLGPPWHTHPGYISEVKGVDLEVSFSWENGKRVETRRYKTPVGTISRQATKDPGYGSNWISKHYITEPEDYRVVQYVVEHTVFRNNEGTLRRKIKDMGPDGVVWGRMDRSPYQKLLIELAGPVRFLTDLYTEPGPAIELLEAMDRRMDEAFEMTCESEVEVIWQPDNVTADMTPPDCFKKYSLPFYEKHARQLKSAGKLYLVHMDGRLKPLKDLIGRCPFDAVESFTFPLMGGDICLSEAMAAWPDKVILPNFPSSLSHQPKEKIDSFLDGFLAEAGKKFPVMLQISEDIPLDKWQETLTALCEFMESQ